MEISASGNTQTCFKVLFHSFLLKDWGFFFILTSSSFRMCPASSTPPQQPFDAVATQCGVRLCLQSLPGQTGLGSELFAAASSEHNSSGGTVGRSEKSPAHMRPCWSGRASPGAGEPIVRSGRMVTGLYFTPACKCVLKQLTVSKWLVLRKKLSILENWSCAQETKGTGQCRNLFWGLWEAKLG